MARGCEIPANVLDFTLFLQAHQQQLQDMRVPESLWRKLHNKVRRELTKDMVVIGLVKMNCHFAGEK